MERPFYRFVKGCSISKHGAFVCIGKSHVLDRRADAFEFIEKVYGVFYLDLAVVCVPQT